MPDPHDKLKRGHPLYRPIGLRYRNTTGGIGKIHRAAFPDFYRVSHDVGSIERHEQK